MTHLQLAATGNLKGFAAGCICDADRHISFRFFHQALADHPALNFLTVSAREGAVIDPKSHRYGGGDLRATLNSWFQHKG